MSQVPEGWDVRATQLRAIYEEKWPELRSVLSGFQDRHLSWPQLVDISAHNYIAAGIKLLVIGQQTRGWYGEWKEIQAVPPTDAVRMLLDKYGEFRLGEDNCTPFWCYAHRLYGLLNPAGPANGFI